MSAAGGPGDGAAGARPWERTRFPGLDVTAQAPHWDAATTGVVLSRTSMPPSIRFFTPSQEAIATGLCDQLLGQADEPLVPLVAMIDARLAEQQTDGWHYADLPEDGQAWQETLGHLDEDARGKFGRGFAECPAGEQQAVIQAVQDLGSGEWHGLNASRVWSLWTRYTCTAFYAHPAAWDEIGFPGPAYPRGYKNAGVGKREPFEVADVSPGADPIRGGS